MELENRVKVFYVEWKVTKLLHDADLESTKPLSHEGCFDFVESTHGIDLSLWNGLYLKLVILFYKETEAFSFYASVAYRVKKNILWDIFIPWTLLHLFINLTSSEFVFPIWIWCVYVCVETYFKVTLLLTILMLCRYIAKQLVI